MKNLAQTMVHDQACQEYGRILEKQGADYLAKTASGSYPVRRAASCLLDPEVGDMVLVSVSNFGDGYVLAILERETTGAATVTFDSDLNLRSIGRLGISARNGLDLASAGEINLAAPTFALTAAVGEVNVERLSYCGSWLESHLGTIRLVAQALDSILERFYRRAKRSYRVVEELDQVKAGQMNYRARDELILRGKVAQVGAEEDVVVSGKMVHLA